MLVTIGIASGLGLAFLAPFIIALMIVLAISAIPIVSIIAFHREPQKMGDARARANVANVLVIEDDPDSAELVKNVLINIGCNVTLALSADEASRHLALGNFDTIILDWYLENENLGSDVINEFERTVEDTQVLQYQFENKIFNLITFSSAPKEDIQLENQKHFKYAGHWQKPLGYHELKSRSLQLVAN
jgi:CheY-like chemotaxis protein